MPYHGKRLPQPIFLSFPHLWCHEQLFVKPVAKSVMNPKTMGARLAVISKSTNKH